MSVSLLATQNQRGMVGQHTGIASAIPMTLDLSGDKYSMVATDVTWNEADAHTVVSTLGSQNYIYVTGKEPVTITISGFVVHKCNGGGTLYQWWNTKRCSKYRRPVKMVLDAVGYSFYITNLTAHVESKTSDIETFVIKGVGVCSQ